MIPNCTNKQAHRLALPRRKGLAMRKLLDDLSVGEGVKFNGADHEIVSIYPKISPLCGYVLLSGIGRPVLASEIGV